MWGPFFLCHNGSVVCPHLFIQLFLRYIYTYGLSKTDTHFVKHENKGRLEPRRKVLSIQFAKKFSCNNYFGLLPYNGHQETAGCSAPLASFLLSIFCTPLFQHCRCASECDGYSSWHYYLTTSQQSSAQNLPHFSLITANRFECWRKSLKNIGHIEG